MKTCSTCKIQKEYSGFSKRRRSKDGYGCRCKLCDKIYIKNWQRKNPEKVKKNTQKWAKRNPEKIRQKSRLWREKNPERTKEARRRWERKNPEHAKEYRDQNPERRKAHCAVNNALRDGKLEKLPCAICGDPETDGHHESYTPDKWLDVIWLCKKHHGEAHSVLRLFS